MELYSIHVLSEWLRGLLIYADTVYTIKPNKGEELGEMYSPDNQGEYVPRWVHQASPSKGCLMP